MSTEKKLYTPEELAAFKASLTETEWAEAKRQQMVADIINPKPEPKIDWSSLGSGDFDREATKLFAEHERKKAQQGDE
jgi:hypothetical protein